MALLTQPVQSWNVVPLFHLAFCIKGTDMKGKGNMVDFKLAVEVVTKLNLCLCKKAEWDTGVMF